jgi:hypothetical protein
VSELQRLKAMGAQCIGGDLILNRQTVGMLRHGQCIVTPEGAELLARPVAAPAAPVAAQPPAEAPAPAPAAAKSKAKNKGKVAEAPADAPAENSTNLDDLLAQ